MHQKREETPVLCYLSRVWYLCKLKVIIWRCPAYARVLCLCTAGDFIFYLRLWILIKYLDLVAESVNAKACPSRLTCMLQHRPQRLITPGPRVSSLNWAGVLFLDVFPHRTDVKARLSQHDCRLKFSWVSTQLQPRLVQAVNHLSLSFKAQGNDRNTRTHETTVGTLAELLHWQFWHTYNNLPEDTRLAQSVTSLKSSLKTHF